MNTSPLSIFSYTAERYAQAVRSRLGKGAEHARLLYQEWFRTGKALGLDPHFKNAGELYRQILEINDFKTLTLAPQGREDQTEKYLLKTEDGLAVEMVVLPMKAGHTLCVSSQVGCRMGCAFCETGKMGLLRSLKAEEMVGQVFLAKHALGINVRNLVFMGMGEPLDNFGPVMEALHILTDMQGIGLGPNHITVSTSGLADKIEALIERAPPGIRLAVSVNAPDDTVRSRLMPVNKSFQMQRLKEAMLMYNKKTKRKIFIEYVLIQGKTDSLEDADKLALYLRGLDVTVNLIPYNPQRRGCFEAPMESQIQAFTEQMKGHGYLTFTRGTKGQKIMAACGQLGSREAKKKLAFSP